MNNKGLTIVELIVSISLISMVMLFLYRMIGDITFEKDNDYIATLNQEQRIEIIDAIEMAFEKADAVTILYEEIFSGYIVKIENNSIIVETPSDNGASNITKWEIKGGTLGEKSCFNTEYIDGYKLVQCTIPVYTTNTKNSEENNNTLDDITYSYMYKLEDNS